MFGQEFVGQLPAPSLLREAETGKKASHRRSSYRLPGVFLIWRILFKASLYLKLNIGERERERESARVESWKFEWELAPTAFENRNVGEFK